MNFKIKFTFLIPSELLFEAVCTKNLGTFTKKNYSEQKFKVCIRRTTNKILLRREVFSVLSVRISSEWIEATASIRFVVRNSVGHAIHTVYSTHTLRTMYIYLYSHVHTIHTHLLDSLSVGFLRMSCTATSTVSTVCLCAGFGFMRACYLRLFFIQGHCHVIANNLYFTAFSAFCCCYWHRSNALSIYFWLITFSRSAKSLFQALLLFFCVCCHRKRSNIVVLSYQLRLHALWRCGTAKQWLDLLFCSLRARNTCMHLWAPIQWLAVGRSYENESETNTSYKTVGVVWNNALGWLRVSSSTA